MTDAELAIANERIDALAVAMLHMCVAANVTMNMAVSATSTALLRLLLEYPEPERTAMREKIIAALSNETRASPLAELEVVGRA